MKISMEFTADELGDLECMIRDSMSLEVRLDEKGQSFMHDEIMADHRRWLKRIASAQAKFPSYDD